MMVRGAAYASIAGGASLKIMVLRPERERLAPHVAPGPATFSGCSATAPGALIQLQNPPLWEARDFPDCTLRGFACCAGSTAARKSPAKHNIWGNGGAAF